MADDVRPLSDEERAELEELRREKAARQRAEKARKERAELEELRAEKERGERRGARKTTPVPVATGGQAKATPRSRRVRTVSAEEARQIERDRAVRERNAKLMEPDDDLSMPIGQKIVLVGIFAAAIIAILAMVFGPK